VGPMLQATRTVPIVFPTIGDPVGAGYVDSMARPGGNVTGFIQFEYSLSGKWLELLKEIAPRVGRVGVLREPGPAAIGQWAIVQAVAQSMGVESLSGCPTPPPLSVISRSSHAAKMAAWSCW
jgi:putative tryptophan/tyrosine transport system substrate-binding protein